MEIKLNKKSMDLFEKSREAFMNLELTEAYEKSLQSLTADPSNYMVYPNLKIFIQSVGFGRPDVYDHQRTGNVIEQSLRAIPFIPIVHNVRGIYYKIEGEFEKAEDSFFRAVHLNRSAKDVPAHVSFLFDLAFVYKNVGKLDIFTQLALSMSWNQLLFRRFSQLALPDEIYRKRMLEVDPSRPPISTLRTVKQNPDLFYLVKFNTKTVKADFLKTFLGAINRLKANFAFFHMVDNEILKKDHSIKNLAKRKIPLTVLQCPAAARIDDFELVVCPSLYRRIQIVIKRIKSPWTVKQKKYGFCPCPDESG